MINGDLLFKRRANWDSPKRDWIRKSNWVFSIHPNQTISNQGINWDSPFVERTRSFFVPDRMARLGRPRKWVAKKVSQADLQQLKILSRRDDASAVALIRGFATFCSLNKNITSRSLMITAFAGQQLQQGMQASSVSTNLQILKSSRVSIENPLAALDQLKL